MLPPTRVIQKDNNNNVVVVFDTLMQASQVTGVSSDSINRMCINGRSKDGFKYEFENQEVKAIQIQREANRQTLKEMGRMINFNL